ncbi:hypothetical protein [Nocardiopsis synnemataformans]|uniref:hypothetical protein n=1 Tax=Nocardiopsis synnemataformans TaxID=61305 RepID=UPI003EC03F47
MADPHGPAPGHMRLRLSVTRAHGAQTTPHGWICPACDHTAPLSTDDYAPATTSRRCRRWYCRFAWNACRGDGPGLPALLHTPSVRRQGPL